MDGLILGPGWRIF